MADRARRGALNWRAGALAEEAVARAYADRGATIAARRLRTPHGEIDLLVREGARVVAVEVKRARTLDEAAHRLTRRQMDRLLAALAHACEAEPGGSLTEQRLDLALVDAQGRVRVVENAFGVDW